MRKWILRALYAAPVLLIGGYALSDYTATQGTVAAFVCQTTKICPGVVIYDITGANGAAVKAASTAAAATDPAMVVAVSPNNTVAVTESGAWNITNISGTVSLPTGAATSALQTTGNTSLATIATNTTVGTAGTAASQVSTIQGIASMTPVQVSQATASNLNATVSQATGTNLHVVCDSGCSGSGGTSITDNAAFTTGTTAETPVGCYAGTPTATANHSTVWSCTTAGSGHVTVDNTNANGQATMANSSPVTLASNQSVGDPCMFQAKTNVPISTATGTVIALVAAVSAKKVYVCSLSLIANAAVAVSLSEGSGATCGTSNQAGVIGVATSGTAANGLSLAANGGLTLGNGGGTIAQTATANNLRSASFKAELVQIAGQHDVCAAIMRASAVILFLIGLLCLAQAQVPMTGAGKATPGGGGGAAAYAYDCTTVVCHSYDGGSGPDHHVGEYRHSCSRTAPSSSPP